jgi:hypothetical protein
LVISALMETVTLLAVMTTLLKKDAGRALKDRKAAGFRGW